MRTFTGIDDLKASVGEEIPPGEWLEITQERVNAFADATGDHQWIHVDPERAAAESPFGGPIAHGLLTLSLCPMLAKSVYAIEGIKMGVNYGYGKVRFPAPVPVGSRIRSNAVISSVDDVAGGVQVTVTQAIEREGADKPVCVAEQIARFYA